MKRTQTTSDLKGLEDQGREKKAKLSSSAPASTTKQIANGRSLSLLPEKQEGFPDFSQDSQLNGAAGGPNFMALQLSLAQLDKAGSSSFTSAVPSIPSPGSAISPTPPAGSFVSSSSAAPAPPAGSSSSSSSDSAAAPAANGEKKDIQSLITKGLKDHDLIDFRLKREYSDLEIKCGEATFYFYRILVYLQDCQTLKKKLDPNQSTQVITIDNTRLSACCLLVLNYIGDNTRLLDILKFINQLSWFGDLLDAFAKLGYPNIKQKVLQLITDNLGTVKWNMTKVEKICTPDEFKQIAQAWLNSKAVADSSDGMIMNVPKTFWEHCAKVNNFSSVMIKHALGMGEFHHTVIMQLVKSCIAARANPEVKQAIRHLIYNKHGHNKNTNIFLGYLVDEGWLK